MTLTTHALVGTAAAALLPSHPLLAFTAAFASHFAIDCIPHRDYELLSHNKHPDPLQKDMAFGKNFLWDLLRTGTDASLGALISLLVFTYIFHIPLLIIAIGVVGGVLPDALQLVYYKLRPRFMTPLQSFHGWIQQTSPLDVPLYMGLGIQVAFLFAVITAEKVFLF